MKNVQDKYYNRVFWLAVFTIVFNFVEGLISVLLGIEDETIALFGFGVDSFVEVISGLGVLQMVIRIRRNPNSPVSRFERKALRITGIAFYILTVGLIAGAIIQTTKGHKPETTLWGVIVSLVSLSVMYWLYKAKISCGIKLNAEPVIADGRCTLVCIYMSVVLLLSSLVYEITGFGWIDTIGALGLAWFSFSEGREALEKAAVNPSAS